MKALIQQSSIKTKQRNLKELLFSERASLLYMIIPLIALVTIFNYIPIFGWIYAFLDYQPGVSIFKQTFVGLYNFQELFSGGSEFTNSLLNSLVLSFLGILTSPIPIVFALLLAEVKNTKVSKLIQTITSLPNFISWTMVFAVFFVFFCNEGFVNTVLLRIGIITEPTNVLADVNAVWFFQTLVAIWKGLGWSVIIYIAALSGVDTELYDAADVDGAGRFGKIWNISLPGMMPTYIVLLLLGVSNMLNSGFEQYFVFRNPLVAHRIDVLDIYTYTMGIGNGEYAYATAVGIFKSVVSISLLYTVNLFSKKTRGQSIF